MAHGRLHSVLIIGALVLGAVLGPRLARAAGPTPLTVDDFVAVETTAPAYTVYVGIPRAKMQAIRASLGNERGVQIVPWRLFEGDPTKFVRSRIVKDEYPGARAVQGVVALVRAFPLTPIGLTWNGGVAITRNDYRYAARMYQRYRADAVEYERTRNRDPRTDPLNPNSHLGPLLGW